MASKCIKIPWALWRTWHMSNDTIATKWLLCLMGIVKNTILKWWQMYPRTYGATEIIWSLLWQIQRGSKPNIAKWSEHCTLPPTSSAAKEQCFSVYFQAQKWLIKTTSLGAENWSHLNSPERWWWKEGNSLLFPVGSLKHPAANSLFNLIYYCGSKTGGGKACSSSCRKTGIKCSVVCAECAVTNYTNANRIMASISSETNGEDWCGGVDNERLCYRSPYSSTWLWSDDTLFSPYKIDYDNKIQMFYVIVGFIWGFVFESHFLFKLATTFGSYLSFQTSRVFSADFFKYKN